MYYANGTLSYSGTAIDGDPGATAQYNFRISVSLGANEHDYKDTVTVTATTESGQKITWTLNQAASVFTYKLVPVASVTTIPAAGGSSVISATYETYRNGSKIDSKSVSPTCSIPSGTAFTLSAQTISIPSRGTTVGDARSVTVTATYGSEAFGSVTSDTVVVSQEKNEITNYGDVILGRAVFDFMGTYYDSPLTIAAEDTSGYGFYATEYNQTITYTSEATREGDIHMRWENEGDLDAFDGLEASGTGSVDFMQKGSGNASEVQKSVTTTMTYIGEGGKSASVSGTIIVEAGVKIYAYPKVNVAVNSDIPALGGSVIPTVTYSQDWYWNTAFNFGGTLTSGGTVTYSNGTTDGAVSAGTLGTTLKDRSSVATVTATVTMNGKSSSKDYTVYQAANTRTLHYNNSDTTSYSDVGADGSPAIPVIGDYPCYWQYSTFATEDIAKNLLSISYKKNWGGGSEHNNAILNTSNGYVTADSLGTTAKERTNVLDVKFIFSIDGGNATKIQYIYQKANQVESSNTTGGETIYNPVMAGAIANKTIPASGGSATATAGEGSQGWTISEKYRHDTYTSGSVADVLVEDSKIGSDTIAPSVASISGSAESKGTTVSGVTTVEEQAVTWTGNGGKKATGTMYIYQEANAAENITYGKPVISSFTVDDIPASGGSISSGSVRYGQSRTQHYTSGDTSQLAQVDSGGTITYSTAVSAGTLGTTVKSRTAIDTLTVTVAMNGQSSSKDATVYQEANSATYGAVSVSVSPNPVSIPAIGAIYNIKPTASQTVSFTSGDTRDGSISFSYAAKNTVTGFSNNGETVTVQQNLSTSPRNGFIVTVTASGESSRTASVDVTFNQAAAAAYLTVDPTTISFAADGSNTTFTIESNDSWTIS